MIKRTLTVIGAAIVCLAAAAPARATFPGANGRIAFVGANDGFIHTIRPDGSGDRRIVQGLTPSWSADGQRIVYMRDVNGQQEIFTIRADGSDQRRLTHNPRFDLTPSFSPNGRRVVFARDLPGRLNYSIVSVRSDGSDHRALARGRVVNPKYSPDGHQIIYGDNGAVWEMRPNGSHKRQLTHPAHPTDAPLDYNPDGNHILIARGGSHHRHLFVMRSDGSRLHSIECSRGIDLSYAPNGRKFVWDEIAGGNQGQKFSDVFTGSLRCTDATRVTDYGESDDSAESPTWQPLP